MIFAFSFYIDATDSYGTSSRHTLVAIQPCVDWGWAGATMGRRLEPRVDWDVDWALRRLGFASSLYFYAAHVLGRNICCSLGSMTLLAEIV